LEKTPAEFARWAKMGAAAQPLSNSIRAALRALNPSPQACALNAIVRDLVNTRDGATYFAGRVWGVSTNYNLDGNNPLVGHSVPNFDFENGATIGD